jgi:hypothetical protein
MIIFPICNPFRTDQLAPNRSLLASLGRFSDSQMECPNQRSRSAEEQDDQCEVGRNTVSYTAAMVGGLFELFERTYRKRLQRRRCLS